MRRDAEIGVKAKLRDEGLGVFSKEKILTTKIIGDNAAQRNCRPVEYLVMLLSYETF